MSRNILSWLSEGGVTLEYIPSPLADMGPKMCLIPLYIRLLIEVLFLTSLGFFWVYFCEWHLHVDGILWQLKNWWGNSLLCGRKQSSLLRTQKASSDHDLHKGVGWGRTGQDWKGWDGLYRTPLRLKPK